MESEEYELITRKFLLKGTSILKIERVENPTLYKIYQNHKELMELKTQKKMEEKQLFHGTKTTCINNIIKEGFDPRFNTRHVFGRGNYFASSPKLAHSYATPDSENVHKIVLATVLVGDSIKFPGGDGYSPPPKNDGTLYDSFVDREDFPTLYVTFERPQSYPCYIITYIQNNQNALSN